MEIEEVERNVVEDASGSEDDEEASTSLDVGEALVVQSSQLLCEESEVGRSEVLILVVAFTVSDTVVTPNVTVLYEVVVLKPWMIFVYDHQPVHKYYSEAGYLPKQGLCR